MGLLIKAEQLASRAIRKTATGGKPRILNLGKSFLEKGQNKNLIERVWTGLSAAKNFVFAAIKKFRDTVISAKNIFLGLLTTGQALWQFDWNASDAELAEVIKSQNIAIASAWGGAFGRSAGWLTGIAIGAGIAMVVPVIGGGVLAASVAAALAPEAIEEISQGFTNALFVTARAFVQNAVLSGYINFRKLVKRLPLATLEKILGPQRARAIKYEWGKEGGPTFSLAAGGEKKLDSIKSPEAKAFWENFGEEAFDSFIEAGFIVAAEIDNAYEQSRAAAQQALGQSRLVEITPDRNSDEKIILAGEEKFIRPQILTTLSNHRLLHNRDVGQWVGNPVDDAIRAKFLNRKLVIVFRDKETPPYYLPGGKRCRTAEYSIPDTRAGLSWKDIKAAASPYMWGPYLLTAKLDNGRQMQVYGANKQAAQKKLEQLLKLSTAKAIKINGSDDILVNARNKKPPTKMYPSFGSVLIRAKSRDNEGRTNLQGQIFDEKLIKFDLYTKEAPEGIPPLNLI